MLEQYNKFITNHSTSFEIEKVNGIGLPSDYIEFMKAYNGGEGDIGHVWVILYNKDELVEYNTEEYIQEDERFKDAFVIGSNGGGECFGIDKNGNYFTTPDIGDSNDTVLLGTTLLDFFEGLNRFFGEG